MAKIGLSKPYFAVYSNDGTTVSYSGGGVLGKYTNLEISLNNGENKFYADNGVAETDDTFGGGTVTVTTDDLRPAALLSALGVVSEAITGVSGVTTEGAAWLVNNDNQAIPFLGLGGIAKKKVDGAVKYVGIVLDKIQFRNPSESFETQGGTITWRTSELVGDIYRSDKASRDWKRVTTLLATEAEAEAAVKAYLGIS